MTVSGMRPDEVRAMAALLRSKANRLRTITETIDARVTRSSWVGPQATRFRAEVWPRHRAQLTGTVHGLETLASAADRQAADQERTSGTTGPGTVLGVSGVARGTATDRGSVTASGSRFGYAESWNLVSTFVNTLGLPGVMANAVSWRRYVHQLYYSPWTQQMPGLKGAVGRFGERVAGATVPHLPENRASLLLGSDRLRPIMSALDSPAMTGAGKFVGVVSVVDEGAKAVQAARDGDYLSAGLHGVDTAAAGLKMSKFPLAFAAGVLVDGVTDIVGHATGKEKGHWNPLSLL